MRPSVRLIGWRPRKASNVGVRLSVPTVANVLTCSGPPRRKVGDRAKRRIQFEGCPHANDLAAFGCERLAREEAPAVIVGVVNDEEHRSTLFQDKGIGHSCHVLGLIKGPVFQIDSRFEKDVRG